MQTHQHELTIKFDDLIEHNLVAMKTALIEIVNTMHASIMTVFYSNVKETAESVGNTLSLKDTGSNAIAFLEVLKKIEFGIGKDGKPSLPQIHASPEMVDAFLSDLRSQGPEFEQEVEQIVREKVAAAKLETSKSLGERGVI